MTKEVIVFTNGDSKLISTWSNVPFFFTEHLIKKGIKVNRVNIGPSHRIGKIYNKIIKRIIDRLYKKNSYDYFRSSLHYHLVRRKIKQAIKQHPNADALIFLTFSFSATGLTNKKTVLFCDWTYEHVFDDRLNRQPNRFEAKAIQREEKQINGSDLVVALFPRIAKKMRTKYSTRVRYLGNVINSVFDPLKEQESAIFIETKKQSKKLLFIGSAAYKEGALHLIKAFERLKNNHSELSLHIIGMDKSAFTLLPQGVHCYGYLDKGNDNEREIYYKLIKEASVFINTTPKWSAFSASIECMSFYTPVIVTPYGEFVETFGKDFSGGYYCEDNTQLEKIIKSVITDPAYESLCLNSYDLVKDFTWDNYIDHLLEEIEQI